MSHKELTKEDMQNVVKAFSDFTNGSIHDYNGKISDAFVEAFFQEHRYLQGEMLKFIYILLGKIGQRADDIMWTDPRNSYWVSWAKCGRTKSIAKENYDLFNCFVLYHDRNILCWI